jgi:deoxyribonuclease V
MTRAVRHRWDLTPKEAVALQRRLAERVIRHDDLAEPRFVAGVDVGFECRGTVARAAVAVLALPSLELVDCALAREPIRFPYVPGLLSFREVPVVLQALKGLRVRPDVLLCDGQGLAHPRRCGFATHMGLASALPTIGVAKTRLCGEHREAPERRGASTPLVDRGEIVGAVLRTRAGVKPLFVSIGHRVSLASAIRLVMACVTRYRLPETTRWAHRLASGAAGDTEAIVDRIRARGTCVTPHTAPRTG